MSAMVLAPAMHTTRSVVEDPLHAARTPGNVRATQGRWANLRKAKPGGGLPHRPAVRLGTFYRVSVSAPSIDAWLPFWSRAKNALIAEPTVYVLVYPVKVTRRGEPGTVVSSV